MEISSALGTTVRMFHFGVVWYGTGLCGKAGSDSGRRSGVGKTTGGEGIKLPDGYFAVLLECTRVLVKGGGWAIYMIYRYSSTALGEGSSDLSLLGAGAPGQPPTLSGDACSEQCRSNYSILLSF